MSDTSAYSRIRGLLQQHIIRGRFFRKSLSTVTATVSDHPGWASLTGRGGMSSMPHDYDPARIQEIYADALEAWRKNPSPGASSPSPPTTSSATNSPSTPRSSPWTASLRPSGTTPKT